MKNYLYNSMFRKTVFFVFGLLGIIASSLAQMSGGSWGNGADILITNSDESNHDGAIRIQSRYNSNHNHWTFWNKLDDGNLYLHNYRSSVNPSQQTVGNHKFTFSYYGELGIGVVNPQAKLHVDGGIIADRIAFGNTTKQMLNLYGTSYGIGVQSNTQYFRSANHFAWYKGGSHNNAESNAGGGTMLMNLRNNGDLNISGNLNSKSIKIQASNAFIGENAGLGNTTGYNNLFIGNDAGRVNTTGYENMYFGVRAGYAGTTGRQNVAMGFNALNENKTGQRNMAIGSFSLGETLGEYNTAVGYDAGRHAKNTNRCTYVGSDAGRRDKYGYYNTFIGSNVAREMGNSSANTGESRYNTIIGGDASTSIAKGSRNTIIGGHAYFGATSGDGNVLIGYDIAASSAAISNQLWIDNSNTTTPLIWGDFASNELKINGQLNVGVNAKAIANTIAHFDGRVYISENGGTEKGFNATTGNANYNDYLLWVEEGIVSKDFAVAETSAWPDFVFDKEYELSSLEQIANHIKEEGHLPNFPAASEVETMGYTLDDMTKRMVQTIEEMTLHSIAQQRIITDLLTRMERLEKK